MKKKIFAANWKMHKTPNEASDFFKEWNKFQLSKEAEVIFFPPAYCLEKVLSIVSNTSIKVGIQNIYFEAEGAFTGENSPAAAKKMGCHYAMVGHSERRKYFNESDNFIAQKIRSAVEHQLVPLLCVGETLAEREDQRTYEILGKQLLEGLKLLPHGKTVVVAYEPVWAIGTGKVATPEMAEEAQQFIRQKLKTLLADPAFAEVAILYGGSVKPENAKELAAMPNVDGFLVGGASLEPDSFLQICESVKKEQGVF